MISYKFTAEETKQQLMCQLPLNGIFNEKMVRDQITKILFWISKYWTSHKYSYKGPLRTCLKFIKGGEQLLLGSV